MAVPRRLSRLPSTCVPVLAGFDVRVASTRRARLLGLAGLSGVEPGTALLLPRTRSVHTLGMLFALDLVWLDARDDPIRIDRAVGPRRVASCRRARAVVELPSGPDMAGRCVQTV
jgi:uncharacterized protein